jgi:hypothetical protein
MLEIPYVMHALWCFSKQFTLHVKVFFGNRVHLKLETLVFCKRYLRMLKHSTDFIKLFFSQHLVFRFCVCMCMLLKFFPYFSCRTTFPVDTKHEHLTKKCYNWMNECLSHRSDSGSDLLGLWTLSIIWNSKY